MRLYLVPLFILFCFSGISQYKAYRLGSRGDTLDIVDQMGQKQGKWLIQVKALRGEPAYEEEGLFLNDKKEGSWRRFNLMGDLMAIENFKWGNKHGICRYFTINGLEREESWRALNPTKAYDTIDVPDPMQPNKFEKVIVKNEGNSMRHGTWKYYNTLTGKQTGIEHYFLDQLKEPEMESPVLPAANSPKNDTAKLQPPEKTKTKEVLEYEKKTSGKKKAVRDGKTGG
ncbi:MAG: hypothetical protein RLZZ28_2551 [Bacteroidota bacterium]|jgi:antitoxin component YwqK of YwqJK toxin-antitoxin module